LLLCLRAWARARAQSVQCILNVFACLYVLAGRYLYSGARKDALIHSWDLRFPRKPVASYRRHAFTNQRISFDLSGGKCVALCSLGYAHRLGTNMPHPLCVNIYLGAPSLFRWVITRIRQLYARNIVLQNQPVTKFREARSEFEGVSPTSIHSRRIRGRR